MESYETYRFRYVRKGGYGLTVLARDRATADEIAEADSVGRESPWKPRRWPFFKRKARVTMPPYDLERSQLEVARERAERRLPRK